MSANPKYVARQEELVQKHSCDELRAMITPLSHAVQSGVALRLNVSSYANPKHLRTGIDLIRAEGLGLAVLLMRKGLITEEEYLAAIVQGLEEEKAYSEREFGVTLG